MTRVVHCIVHVHKTLTHQLHVVDQGVAVLPGQLGVAAEDRGLNVLAPVQLPQGGGEQQRRVVHQGRLRLQCESQCVVNPDQVLGALEHNPTGSY